MTCLPFLNQPYRETRELVSKDNFFDNMSEFVRTIDLTKYRSQYYLNTEMQKTSNWQE